MTCFHSILTVTLRVALASKATFSSIHGEEASCASSDGHCCRHGKLSCTHFEPCEVPAAPEVFMVQYFATKSTTSGSTQETDGEELRNDRKKSYRSKLVDATIEACDWQCYLSRYPDLQTALGATNTAGAEAHYLAQGQAEGRDCTCSDAAIEACDWQCYLRRYPDLQTALGATNTAGAEAHYLANGQSEGRGCTCSDDKGDNIDSTAAGNTPECVSHPTSCTGLCDQVSKFTVMRMKEILNNPDSWSWYYNNVLNYYTCINAKKVVEVGAAYMSQTQYILNHRKEIEEYHVVDPFMAGYDEDDPMSKEIHTAAPNATPADISVAWAQSLSKAIGVDGVEGSAPAGCKLRVHRMISTEGAKLFGDHSVDAVFIDGLHTYEGVVDDIKAWASKVAPGGTLLFNDCPSPIFPGIVQAVQEEAKRRNVKIRRIDGTNAILGGDERCSQPYPEE